jgi:hypothetical protein
LEHLPQSDAERAIAYFCQASDDILFSSTPLDYREVTHFNVQPIEYWTYQFALHGFVRDVDFDASFITPWAVRFRRNREPWPRVLQDYERRFWLLWKENSDLRRLTMEMRQQLVAGEARAMENDQQWRRPQYTSESTLAQTGPVIAALQGGMSRPDQVIPEGLVIGRQGGESIWG